MTSLYKYVTFVENIVESEATKSLSSITDFQLVKYLYLLNSTNSKCTVLQHWPAGFVNYYAYVWNALGNRSCSTQLFTPLDGLFLIGEEELVPSNMRVIRKMVGYALSVSLSPSPCLCLSPSVWSTAVIAKWDPHIHSACECECPSETISRD